MENVFAKKSFNLTEQMRLIRENPELAAQLKTEAAAIDAADERKKKTRTVKEFAALDAEGKIEFIKSGGRVV